MKILEVYNEVLKDGILYHGTGHNFLEFSTDNIGSGEGNQSFGWGLYFTDSRGLAEHYAKILGDKIGYVYVVKLLSKNFLMWNRPIDIRNQELIAKHLKDLNISEIPIKRMLSGGKIIPIYKSVDEALGYYPTFKYLYENLSLVLGGDKMASNFLFNCGIDGIKYASDSFSNIVKGFSISGFNYVIFSGSLVKVIDVNKIDL